jgi:hypothetical protein
MRERLRRRSGVVKGLSLQRERVQEKKSRPSLAKSSFLGPLDNRGSMPNKDEKRRREELIRAMLEKRGASDEARMPISKPQLKALLEMVEQIALDDEGECVCDHTLNATRQFLRVKGLQEEAILTWLAEYGGRCDCEVVMNVGESWGEQVGFDAE